MRREDKSLTTAVLVIFSSLAIAVPSFAQNASREDVNALKQQLAQLSNKIAQLDAQSQVQPTQADQPAQQKITIHFPMVNPALAQAIPATPTYDVKETDKAYVITFNLPGIDKSKVNVEVKAGALVVSGQPAEGGTGFFSTMIQLPKGTKPEDVKAKYNSGSLTVTVDKKNMPKPDKDSYKVQID